MATHPTAIVRPLTAIVCDMATTSQRLSRFYADEGDLSDAELRECDALEDRKSALEAEFDAAIYSATGVSWELLEGARA